MWYNNHGMKNKFALVAAAVAMSVAASAQLNTWSTSLYYDLNDKSWAAVVTKPITTFKNVLGKGHSLDLDAFAGATFNGGPVAGFSLGKRFPLADTATGYVGFGAKVESNRPVSFGPVAGVSIKF